MNKLCVTILALLSLPVLAQQELSSFTSTGRGGATTFVTDYQAVGINPANLGWTWEQEQKKVAFGFAEYTYSIHSDALSKQSLRDELGSILRNRTTEDFTHAEKVQAGQDFANAGLAFNVDFGSFGGAITLNKFGGLAFRINDRFQWYSQLGPQASELLFQGKTSSYFDSLIIVNGIDTSTVANDPSAYDYDTLNVLSGFASIPQALSSVLDGTRMSLSWYREYNLSYGRKIIELDSVISLYGGIGVKYLQGMAIMDLTCREWRTFCIFCDYTIPGY